MKINVSITEKLQRVESEISSLGAPNYPCAFFSTYFIFFSLDKIINFKQTLLG